MLADSVLSDAAQWFTIIGVLVVVGTTCVTGIFFMAAMYFQGRSTAKAVTTIEKDIAAIWKWTRRKHRKSDIFHVQATGKLRDHEGRILELEAEGGPPPHKP